MKKAEKLADFEKLTFYLANLEAILTISKYQFQ